MGDCFDVPTENVDVKDVQHHPCNESHTGEVFALVTHPAAKGTAPLTEDALIDYIASACGPTWVTYVGQEAAGSSVFDVGAFYPRDQDWNDGERSVTCYTYRVDGAAMSSSLKK